MENPKCNFDFGGYRHTKENAKLIKQRKEKIVQMRQSGISFDEIAKSFGISKARCRKIYSTAIQKPKSIKVASAVRDVLKSYLPFVVLKDGAFVKINYPLLFLLLESKSDYFKTHSAKTYTRLIVHSSRSELLLMYNKLLSRLGEKTLAEKWIRSDSAVVPSCFWKDKSIEDFLLKCYLTKRFSSDASRAIVEKIEEIASNSPSFIVDYKELFGDSTNDTKSVMNASSLLHEVEELEQYISIVKNDESLKREDYVLVLDTALTCVRKLKDTIFSKEVSSEASVDSKDIEVAGVDNVSKPKPKAFWPKPNFK